MIPDQRGEPGGHLLERGNDRADVAGRDRAHGRGREAGGEGLELRGQGVRADNIETSLLELQASLAWPKIELSKVEVRFTNNAVARATAVLDLQSRSIAGGKLVYSGLLPGNFLPAGYAYGGIEASIQADGPWGDPVHSGRIAITNLSARVSSRCALTPNGTASTLISIDLKRN